MGIKEGYGLIDENWAIDTETSAFHLWIRGKEIGESVEIRKLGGLVVNFSLRVYDPTERQDIATRRQIIEFAFGHESRLTTSYQLVEAAKVRGGESDPIACALKQIDTTGVSLAWSIPLDALRPVIDIEGINQSNLFEVPSYRDVAANSSTH